MNTFLLIIKAIVMGIVEGITEFLPISSTGHMILATQFIGFTGGAAGFSKNYTTLFEVVIQLGAILAIVVLYRKKIFHSLRTLKPGGFGFRLWTGLILAMVPAGIVGLCDKALHDPIEKYVMQPVPVSLALVVGGFWMIFAERKYRGGGTTRRIEQVTYRQAFVIGVFQCLAIVWSGFSRSASTIIGGWIVGLTTPAAAEFSFFLAIPAMFLASGAELVTNRVPLGGVEIVSLIAGFVTAFIVALIVVKAFIGFLQHRPLKGFAVYRIAVGALMLVLFAAHVVA